MTVKTVQTVNAETKGWDGESTGRLVVEPDNTGATAGSEGIFLNFQRSSGYGSTLDYGYVERAAAEELRDRLVERYGPPTPVQDGPLASFIIDDDVYPGRDYATVEASSGELFIRVVGTDLDIDEFEVVPQAELQLTAQNAVAFANSILEIAENIGTGTVFDAETDA